MAVELKLTLDSVCAGGDHAQIRAELNSVDKGTFFEEASRFSEPMSDAEIEEFVYYLLRLAATQYTKAQIVAVLSGPGLLVTMDAAP